MPLSEYTRSEKYFISSDCDTVKELFESSALIQDLNVPESSASYCDVNNGYTYYDSSADAG